MRARYALATRPYRNARELLLTLGLSQQAATLAIPLIWFAPSTSDPDAPAILMLVQAIQQRLRERRYPVEITGYLDPPTQHALTACCGRGWAFRPWTIVAGQVLAAPAARARAAPARAPAPPGMGRFNPGKGYCEPPYPEQLTRHIELQRQLNRLAKALGISQQITTDGKIGDRTVAFAQKIGKVAWASRAGEKVAELRHVKHCLDLDERMLSWTRRAKMAADAAGVPAGAGRKPPGRRAPPPSGPGPGAPPGREGLFARLAANPAAIAALIIGGAIVAKQVHKGGTGAAVLP